MTPRSKPQEPDGRNRRLLAQQGQSWALVVTGASTMIAGLVIGYAFGTAQTLNHALLKGEHGN